jgi:hypothetical protein
MQIFFVGVAEFLENGSRSHRIFRPDNFRSECSSQELFVSLSRYTKSLKVFQSNF